jgi:hypothetical protein
MAGSVGGDGRASSGQEFRHQDQAGHAVGIAQLFAIHAALQKGFFARRGLDIEVIQMAAGFKQ